MMVFIFKLLNSSFYRINNSLPCRDLNPGPPDEKQMTYQCATVLLGILKLIILEKNNQIGCPIYGCRNILLFYVLYCKMKNAIQRRGWLFQIFFVAAVAVFQPNCCRMAEQTKLDLCSSSTPTAAAAVRRKEI